MYRRDKVISAVITAQARVVARLVDAAIHPQAGQGALVAEALREQVAACLAAVNVIISSGGEAAAAPQKTPRKARQTSPAKQHHGEYGNVRLTEQEHARLYTDYGVELTDRAIAHLDLYIGSKGKDPYGNHNLTMRKWVFAAVKEADAREARSRGAGQNSRNMSACEEWLGQ